MTSWPTHVEPLDRAILDLLCSLPATWREHDPASLTSTQGQAMRLMTDAGLVERRAWLVARMDGQGDEVEMIVVVSGEGVMPLIWRQVFKTAPHWVDANGRTRGGVTLAVGRVQIRLSDQGDLARHDYQNQTVENPSAVVAFVRRQGIYAFRGPVTPSVRVESCRVRTATAGGTPQPQTVIAAAQARTGDITVNNVVQIDPAAVVQQVLAELARQGAPAPKPPAAPPTSPPATEAMSDAVRRAGASLEWVRNERPELAPDAVSGERYSKEQYDHIREHGGPSYPLEGDRRSTVPSWDTWTRYVREYLRLTEGRRNEPRRGGTSRSVVRPEDVADRRRSDRDDE